MNKEQERIVNEMEACIEELEKCVRALDRFLYEAGKMKEVLIKGSVKNE